MRSWLRVTFGNATFHLYAKISVATCESCVVLTTSTGSDRRKALI